MGVGGGARGLELGGKGSIWDSAILVPTHYLVLNYSSEPNCHFLSTEDVSLNPVTSYPFLILSDDRKQVKRGEKLQFYRNSTQRFDVWSCVLAKDGFNSGRHYWEVRGQGVRGSRVMR